MAEKRGINLGKNCKSGRNVIESRRFVEKSDRNGSESSRFIP
jgi:hypothetical protein